MRPISFRKGTLTLQVPNRVAEATHRLLFRSYGEEWAVVFYDQSDAPIFIGAGWYRHRAGQIQLGGAEAREIPTWWEENGNDETPEPWSVVELFGHGPPVVLGADDTAMDHAGG